MINKKTLIIARHAKSSWEYPDIADIDRPLNEKGIKKAYETGERMLKANIIPEKIISSNACRAIHTALIYMRVLSIPDSRLYPETDMYLADYEDLMKIIANNENNILNLMIVGHNPGFTELANHLSDTDLLNIPTSGIVLLEFNAECWKDINKKNCNLSKHLFPGK